MQMLFVLIAAAFMSGCQLFKADTLSNWATLDVAKSVECDNWPKASGDLGLDTIHYGAGAFSVSGKNRQGRPLHYLSRFDGETEIERDEVWPLKLGRGSLLLGSLQWQDKIFAATLRRDAKGSHFELRSANDNVVRFKQLLSVDKFTSGRTVANPIGDSVTGGLTGNSQVVWLVLESEDGNFKVASLDLRAQEPKVELVRELSLTYPLRLIVGQAPGQASVYWHQGSRIFRQQITEFVKAGNSEELPLKESQNIESFAVARVEGTTYVAVINGDSLVGQAALQIYTFSDESLTRTPDLSSIGLPDVHLSEPVFVKNEDELKVLVLTWVDEEATIASFLIGKEVVSPAEYLGIFPKGSRILQAFSDGEDDIFAVVRYRQSDSWTFALCEI